MGLVKCYAGVGGTDQEWEEGTRLKIMIIKSVPCTPLVQIVLCLMNDAVSDNKISFSLFTSTITANACISFKLKTPYFMWE